MVALADGEVPYEREPGNEYGFHVVDAPTGYTTRALSMATILSYVPAGERHYEKMDIEGVESPPVGRDRGWTARVDVIALQVHAPYTLETCARDLFRLGFAPRIELRRANYILGARDMLGQCGPRAVARLE
jgi:hypothetical protein